MCQFSVLRAMIDSLFRLHGLYKYVLSILLMLIHQVEMEEGHLKVTLTEAPKSHNHFLEWNSSLLYQVQGCHELTIYHHEHLSLPQWSKLIKSFVSTSVVKLNLPSQIDWIRKEAHVVGCVPTQTETVELDTTQFVWSKNNIDFVTTWFTNLLAADYHFTTIQFDSYTPTKALNAWKSFTERTWWKVIHTEVWQLPPFLAEFKCQLIYQFPDNTSLSDFKEQLKNLKGFSVSQIGYDGLFQWFNGKLRVLCLDLKHPFLEALVEHYTVNKLKLQASNCLFNFAELKKLAIEWARLLVDLPVREIQFDRDYFCHPSLYLRYLIPAIHNNPRRPDYSASSFWEFLWLTFNPPLPARPQGHFPLASEDVDALQDWCVHTGTKLTLTNIVPGWIPLLPHSVATEETVNSLPLDQLGLIWSLKLKQPSLEWVQSKATWLLSLIDLDWQYPSVDAYVALLPHLTRLQRLAVAETLDNDPTFLAPRYTSITDVLNQHCTSLAKLEFYSSPKTTKADPWRNYFPPSLTLASLTQKNWDHFLQQNIRTISTLQLDSSDFWQPTLAQHAHLFQNLTKITNALLKSHTLPVWISFLKGLEGLTCLRYITEGMSPEDQDLWLEFLEHQTTLTDLRSQSRYSGLELVSKKIESRVMTRNKTLLQLNKPKKSLASWEYLKEQTQHLEDEGIKLESEDEESE